MSSTASPTTPSRRLSPSARKLVLTVHVVSSVGLLGSSCGLLVAGLAAANAGDAASAHAIYELMQLVVPTLAIPLSLLSLVSGLLLSFGTAWSLLRHRWVAIKLVILLATILTGALVIGSGVEDGLAATEAGEIPVAWLSILGAAGIVVGLVTATALSVYRPRMGRSRRAARTAA